MSTWGKLDSDIRTNGKVAEAAADAGAVAPLTFFALMTLHTAKGCAGVIPASCCKPSRLRVEAGALLGIFAPDDIENGIAACVRAGLCAMRADGAIELRGWCDAHAVACSHCRKPNPEPSHKTCPTCREARKADRKPSSSNGARKSRAHGAKRAQNGAIRSHLAALDSVCVSVSDNPPNPPHAVAREGQRADARGVDRSAKEPDSRDPTVAIQQAMLGTDIRSKLKPLQRGIALRKLAEAMQPTGLAAGDVAALWGLAQRQSDSDPGALLDHWLTENIWREVIDRERSAEKERGIDARKALTDDPLEGVYGS